MSSWWGTGGTRTAGRLAKALHSGVLCAFQRVCDGPLDVAETRMVPSPVVRWNPLKACAREARVAHRP